MKQSAEIDKLAVALVAVQSEVRGVAKDSTNPDFRSSYTSLDAIIEKTRPILTKHGLAVVQGATTPHSDDTGRIAAIAVETLLVHASGQWLSNSAIMPVVGRMLKGGGRGDVDPQAGGSALTYGRRYGLAALLCLSTDEDDDGNHASRPAKVPAKPERVTRPLSAPAAPTAKPLLIKGKPLADADLADIRHAKQWYEENGGTQKYAAQIEQVDQELARRTDA